VKSDNPLETDDKWRVVSFERSPVMSTYLLAFVVGEYDYVESRDADGVIVRVFTPLGKKELGQFALDVIFFSVLQAFLETDDTVL
jgi:puromycin-sensitive aminopeptidase